jgi:hypothetical protein
MAHRFQAKFFLLAVSVTLSTHTAASWADRVVMRDGTVRNGTVIGQDASNVTLKIGSDGLSMTMRIPMADVANVELTPKAAPGALATQPGPHAPAKLNSKQAGPTPTTAPATRPAVARSTKYFFREAALMAMGADAAKFDPESLPSDQAKLWSESLAADAKHDEVAEASALTNLVNTPGVDLRVVQKLCMREHGALLGDWLGKVRWDTLEGKSHFGQFDLHEVTAIETPALIGHMRAATASAINPVRAFYPLPSYVLDLPKASRPADPMAGIQPENATRIKEFAFYASALVSAQLKLEPTMPTGDKSFLLQHLGSLRQIIGRCAELEPQEWAAETKRNREAKEAAERARQDAIKQRQLGPPPVQ